MDFSRSGRSKNWFMMRIVELIFSLSSLFTPSLHAFVTEACVTPVCSCTSNNVYNVTVTCNTTDLKHDLHNYITKPQLVLALSVTNNNTTIITSETFSGLSNLLHLELNIKHLKIWRGNLSLELPSLATIRFQGDNTFVPPDHVLRGRNLQNISGVTWNNDCIKCTLVKNETHATVTRWKKGSYDVYPESRCRGSRYVVNSMSRKFAEYGFLPSCLDDKKCVTSEVAVIPLHQCWKKANQVLYVEYFLAPLIIILNLLVVLTTLTTKSLKKIPSMLLVTNMAASDFLVGVYSLAITCYRNGLPYPKFVEAMKYLCPTLGFFWVIGQFMAVLSSVLLTSERYIVIVFSMRPSVSFTTRFCLSCMVASWVIAVFIATLPLFGIGTYTSTTFCVPIQPVKGIPHSFAYSTSIVAIGFLLYTVTFPLYLRIFIHVRRSSHQMGIKRDGKLAKKISLLVVSNFMFFMLPVFIGLLWMFTGTFSNMAVTTREILVGSFTTVCFSTNSFLNPLLYAFRDRRFQSSIKQKFYRVIHRNTIFVQNISYISRRDTRTRAPESSVNH